MKTAQSILRLIGRQGGPAILLVVSVSLLIALLPFRSSGQSAQRLMAQDDQEECQRWQYRDRNGDCVDRRDTFRPSGDYHPHSGEQCWVECLCHEGQFPGGNGCSPCSYVGLVCIGH